ncbi:MAG: hypothetical protein JSU85_11920 [Candidatus Zixiibacteriota bacterium]|nr:MAG: hypothetical protein JSU85_11920 [candidate division Zixibacteria bacterium]
MIRMLAILTLFIISDGFYTTALCSDDKKDPLNKFSNHGKELIDSLINVGNEIAELIINKDALGLLKFVDKDYWMVSYGGDLYKNYDEVKADLSDTTSNLYCRLFDNSCYPWSAKKSIREYLSEAKSKNLTTRIGMTYDLDLIYGTIFYEWDGIKDELGSSWIVEIPNPEFVLTESGWVIISIFGE